MLTHLSPYGISMSLTILCASKKKILFFKPNQQPSLTAKTYIMFLPYFKT